MGFLIITCIEPASKFLGCIPITLSLIIMAAITILVAIYNYYEATVYFKEVEVFGFLNKIIYCIIEFIIALLIFVTFIIRKKSFSLIMYLVTLAHAGFGLAINIYKLSIFKFESEVKQKELNVIEWLYFMRVVDEFLIEIMICYIIYSDNERLKCKDLL